MRRVHALLLLLALITVASAATVVLYTRSTTIESMTIPMDLKVDTVAGFNLDTDAIHFGKVPPGNEGIRNVTLANKKGFPIFAEMYVQGSLEQWVSISENPVFISPYSNKSVTLIAAVPDSAEHGYYSSNLVVVLRRA